MSTRVRSVAGLRNRRGLAVIAALAVGLSAVAGSTGTAAASPPSWAGHKGKPPKVVGYPAVDSPTSTATPTALPKKSGTVAVTGVAAPSGTTTTTSKGMMSLLSADVTASAGVAAVAPVTSTRKVELRALVVTTDNAGDDYGLPTWTSTLGRVGAEYDVLNVRNQALTPDMLVNADGTGRYNAVLLTNAMMLYQDSTGSFVAAMDDAEWNTLWAYERDFAVRQATLYASYGTWPEDYCLRAGSGEGSVGDTAITATLTTAGKSAMDFLKPGAQIPVMDSYVYRDTLDPACGGSAVLTSGADVLASSSVSADGRERLALSFTSNQYLIQANLLAFGLFRWASQGLYLGQQQHYLKLDVDDYFGTSDVLNPDFTVNSDPGYQMSGHDAYNVSVQQSALRSRYPLAKAFEVGFAYNADGIDNPKAKATCYPTGGVSTLDATTKCLRKSFEWINHTYSHADMNVTDYATSYNEINQNIKNGNNFGVQPETGVLKTGEYSGLGVYNPDPNDDIDPPTDYGLMASNGAMLQAASNLGIKYVHGNMSFPSHVPSCFNCSIVHPMQPSISVVPDWPTNIAYFSTTPDQETQFYNWYYGPGGKFPYWTAPQTYEQVIDHETSQALTQLATGSIYTHTMHIDNVYDYGGGRTLAFDWLDSLVGKYSSYYSVPLLSPAWATLAATTTQWNSHFATKDSVRAVYDPVLKTITLTPSVNGALKLTGVRAPGYTSYGTSSMSDVALTAGVPASFPVALLP